VLASVGRHVRQVRSTAMPSIHFDLPDPIFVLAGAVPYAEVVRSPSLRQAYSRLKLYLVEDLTERLIQSLHRGELDVVLLALPYDCGAVETVTLFEDPFMVGLPREHLLAKETRVKPERLWHEDLLLLKDGHCLRDHALAVCRLAD